MASKSSTPKTSNDDLAIQTILLQATASFQSYRQRGFLPSGILKTAGTWHVYGFGIWDTTFASEAEAREYLNRIQTAREEENA